MEPVAVARSRTIPAGRDVVYDVTLPIDLAVLFRRWYGPIPPIAEVRDQVGAWATAGQTRTVVLRGGGSMREELVATDAPASFDYRLTEIRGPLAPLVDHVEGRWQLDAAGPGATTVTWSWRLHPRSALARPVVQLVGKFWEGYARGALAELERQVAARPA